jgi:hypothetical protein
MKKLYLPDSYEYIGVFLTFECTYHCKYCINRYETDHCIEKPEVRLTGEQWIAGLSRLRNVDRPGGSTVPITLQGGEPTLHPGFFDIVNGLEGRLRLDVLTNLSGKAEDWIENVDPKRLTRDAPYASIRVSYHPLQQGRQELLQKVLKLQNAGFSVGVYGIDHPDFGVANYEAEKLFKEYKVDFRTKEFLGLDGCELMGTYQYPDACRLDDKLKVRCKTHELLIAPDGNIYRCHRDLYEGGKPIGHIMDDRYQIEDIYRPCDCYGYCNPCDVKRKTNRLQEFGYTAVTIQFVGN